MHSSKATHESQGCRVTTVPTPLLIDRLGQIVKRFSGNTEHKTMQQEVERLHGRPGR